NIAYIQFQTGLLAKIERESLLKASGDLAKFTFVGNDRSIEELNTKLDDYDQIIIGTAPFDYPEGQSIALKNLVDLIYKRNFPCLGIDFGHLVLADKFGFKIERKEEFVELNKIVEVSIKNTHTDISPTIKLDLSETEERPKFYAYVN